MDKVKKYIQIADEVITSIYNRYAAGKNKQHYMLVKDKDSSNYLFLMNHWVEGSRFYGILIHIEVKVNGLVYLHDDNTDLIVVDQLLERGIIQKDIVMGWHTPIMRTETAFAHVQH